MTTHPLKRPMRCAVAALAAALVAGCATTPPSPTSATGPAIAVHAIDCGRIVVSNADVFADDGSFAGVTRGFVDPCYLIRHPAGDLLWDTGLPSALRESGPQTLGPFTVRMERSLEESLAMLGMVPDDVEFLSISHSHFDHVGNAGLFANSAFLVDPAERAFMFRDEARDSQDFSSYAALESAETVLLPSDAPHDVFGDGSVVIHPTPGHTPGHRVLFVRLEEQGPLILSGDMFHMAESRTRRTVPRFNTDRAQTLASFERVEALADETGARVIRQHVPEDFALFPAFPEAMR